MNTKPLPTLIMTVGLPRSGKSTWAKQTGMPIVNPDSIRLAIHGQAFLTRIEPLVWAIAHLMVQALFYAGHDRVILDATNVTEKRRREWVSAHWNLDYVCFKTSKVECVRRAQALGREDLVPIIERMADNLVWPEDRVHSTTFLHHVE